LNVYIPGQEQPLQEASFAKNQLLNLSSIYGHLCPLKFRYYHPDVKPSTSLDFMQAGDGELYCRVFAEGRFSQKGKVVSGSQIEMPGEYVFTVSEHKIHGKQKINFEPVPAKRSQKNEFESAVEVEIFTGGSTHTLWLQRNLSTRTINTDDGPLQVRFGHGELRLGFSMKLVRFRHEVNPGGVGNAAFASTVLVTDADRGIEEEHEISMNHPLSWNRLTFYQSGFDNVEHGGKSSTLSVGRDSGRTLKYFGSLMICVGIGIMFYMRAYFFKRSHGTRSSG
jgi:hypothetical protein